MADEEQQDQPQEEQAQGEPEEQAQTSEPEQAQTSEPEEQAQTGEAEAEAGDAADETGAEPQGDAPQADEQTPPQGDEPSEAKPEEGRPEPEETPAGAPKPAPRKGKQKKDEPEVIPGEHLEPDLVLEEEQQQAPAAVEAEAEAEAAPDADAETDAGEDQAPPRAEEPKPAARTPLDLAADARYQATGKRKSAVARVVLKPGSGSYTINGRQLDEFFPRRLLQTTARQPLEAAGYSGRMDVVAKIHGGGVSAQAGALRHGVARALVEADPNLRGELKREGFLRRDPRVKERKKAGLKKARKRPQFSKR